MEKRYKYIDGYLSRGLLYQNNHPLRDAVFSADCLTPLRILKSKNWIQVMLSRIATCYNNCQILICSRLEMNSLHLLSKFRGYIFDGVGKK